MKPETRNALLKAYAQLQLIIDELYDAHDKAVANDDDEDASLLYDVRLINHNKNLSTRVETLQCNVSTLWVINRT